MRTLVGRWTVVILILVAAGIGGLRVATAHPGHDDAPSAATPTLRTVSLADDDAADDARPHVTIAVRDGLRFIEADGLPDHETGRFPNRGNPNTIRPQRYAFKAPTTPRRAERPAFVGGWVFGVGTNGVPFDPLTAEYFQGDRNSPWRYEAISPTLNLGLDASRAHVQPNGAYHYHGVPTGLVERRAATSQGLPVLLGYAADGYPIYTADVFRPAGASARTGEGATAAKKYRSSYRLKQGARPAGPGNPGGNYDGTFGADFEYVAGSGDLDECNGRTGPTPEHPEGTYYYAITDEFPFIPRYFRGVPDESFAHAARRAGPPGRPPGRPRLPPF